MHRPGALAPGRGRRPGPVVTHHTITIGGRAIAYTARAGTMPLRNADGDEIARVFTVSYTADGRRAHAPGDVLLERRPGNGDDVAAQARTVRCAWPCRRTRRCPPGTPLVPNPESMLDMSDLVFIDAVGTGYSQITGKGTPKTFYGIDEDAKAFDGIIRAWTTDNDRWASPKFLFGESYGTMRAAAVAAPAADGMALNGIILLSSAIDYNALDVGQGPGEDYGTCASCRRWPRSHGTTTRSPAPPDLERFVAEVRAFAIGPYADALMRGDTLDAATRRAIVAKLHEYTGLDEAYIDRANLRIDPTRFEHALHGVARDRDRPARRALPRAGARPHRRFGVVRPTATPDDRRVRRRVHPLRARRPRLQGRPPVHRHELGVVGATGTSAEPTRSSRRTARATCAKR